MNRSRRSGGKGSTPGWRSFLDQLVEHWAADDPDFDAAELRAGVLAEKSPGPAEIVEHVMGLADHWVAQADGSAQLDMERFLDKRHEEWLERNVPASLPALLLALRHHDHSAQLAVDAILGKLRPPVAAPALLSVLDHPAANLGAHLGGRPQHFPTYAMVQLGPPAPETASRLVAALDHEDFRIADAAAQVLAEFSTEERFFDPLLARLDRARGQDGFAWALMRAAEVRRDPSLRPFLTWMQKSSRFRSAGYPERIREAIAGLRKARRSRRQNS